MNRTPASGAQVAPLTFDDEAGAKYTATSPAGRYQPFEPLSENDGSAAGGTWRLIAYNWNATTAAKVTAWSLTITYTVCDGDGDGAEDHTDNCVGLSNADQADQDSDRIGDPCDDDVDGDGAANGTDNCLVWPTRTSPTWTPTGRATPATTTATATGSGRATTARPSPTPTSSPPTATPWATPATSTTTVTTPTPATAARSSGPTRRPAALRGLDLKIKHQGKVFKGRLSSGLPGCRADREVSVFKQRKGKDRRLDRAGAARPEPSRPRSVGGRGSSTRPRPSASFPGLPSAPR